DAGAGDRRDEAVRGDLADPVAQVGDEHVALRIDGHAHGLVDLRVDGRTAIAEVPGHARAREKLERGRRHGGGRARREGGAGETPQRDRQATEEHTAGHGGTSWRESLADTGQDARARGGIPGQRAGVVRVIARTDGAAIPNAHDTTTSAAAVSSTASVPNC